MKRHLTKTSILSLVAAFCVSVGVSSAHAAIITFTDTDLASGNPVTVGGVTLTTTTVGGSISFISSGPFTGLWLGNDNSSGSYTLGFSQSISSVEIEFDALSSVGTLPVETLTNFATNNGSVSIGYTNQFGTTFDGTTITSTANDGQGIINFSGAPFDSFLFDHDQGMQAGFVIERVVINTNVIPEPASVAVWSLLCVSVIGCGWWRRKHKA